MTTDQTARIAEVDCPLCGETVKQVASATLSLALWQHTNWTCKALEILRRERDEWQRLARQSSEKHVSVLLKLTEANDARETAEAALSTLQTQVRETCQAERCSTCVHFHCQHTTQVRGACGCDVCECRSFAPFLPAPIDEDQEHKTFTRGVSVPGVGHGDLPRRSDGDD